MDHPNSEAFATYVEQAKQEGQQRARRLTEIWTTATQATGQEVKNSLPTFRNLGKAIWVSLLARGQQLVNRIQIQGKDQLQNLAEEGPQLRNRVSRWDKTLEERYGDRYRAVKQRFKAIARWYQQQRQATAAGAPNPVQHVTDNLKQQTQQVATKVAQQETKFKATARTIWQQATRSEQP